MLWVNFSSKRLDACCALGECFFTYIHFQFHLLKIMIPLIKKYKCAKNYIIPLIKYYPLIKNYKRAKKYYNSIYLCWNSTKVSLKITCVRIQRKLLLKITKVQKIIIPLIKNYKCAKILILLIKNYRCAKNYKSSNLCWNSTKVSLKIQTC
jgi:hypothetical protein